MTATVDDDPPVSRDAKAGYSTICRRGEHQTCSMLQARCSCTCHGKHGQQPPTAPSNVTPIRPPDAPTATSSAPRVGGTPKDQAIHIVRTETPMTDVDITAPATHRCEPCDRDFPSAQGLALHRTRKHAATNGNGHKPKLPTSVRAKPTSRAAAAPAPSDDLVVIVLHEQGGGLTAETTVCAAPLALELAGILGRLGHRTFVLNPATATLVAR